MPGGKIVVYTGILPITKDDAGLATVMGHEVSHALANHGAQRMSAAQLQQIGAAGVAVASSGKSELTQQILQQAYGIGSQVGVMLPFSRSHESEADQIGLTLMAIAGYNPQEAMSFWQRMSAGGGQKPPEIMRSDTTNPNSNFSSLMLTGTILLANVDISGLVNYGLKAVIGGAIWLGFKVAADYIDKKRKTIQKNEPEQ